VPVKQSINGRTRGARPLAVITQPPDDDGDDDVGCRRLQQQQQRQQRPSANRQSARPAEGVVTLCVFLLFSGL